ncbi:hypothetical protein BT93_L1015 [Corymbia citriodora subsp. variegata]|uniref:Leucine-rich repeat-containing N-terminal plant-type domain-containing protein n=1 Tax=Corymbia citriodora subsp. variegata TaxID=360336 RepID=A0A8T0CNZ7_CORYI|nr:hypothetical protein BT93_L1015 [Corymbia citriodora subsp. variegata]
MASSPAFASLILWTLLVFQSFEFGHSEALTNVSCFGAEREALLKFKKGLIDHSKRLSSWSSDNCCAWKGVECNKKTGHVIKLDLHNPTSPCETSPYGTYSCETFYEDFLRSNYSSLRGNIHASLAELKHLKYLDLSFNKFFKQKIPQFFGTLRRLEYLNLSSAGFDGNIPHHLGNLSNLQYLDLANMFGAGNLTTVNLQWVSKLSSLKYFDLSGIDLRNAKDWLSSINRLSSLQSLRLEDCSLEQLPHSLSVNLTSLRFLDLRDNSINSTMPLWFHNFSKLEHIDLNRNYLRGTFSRTLFDNNQQLSFLDVSNNLLEGQILKNFSSLYKLRVLRLAKNNFDGDVWSVFHGPLESAQSDLRICYFDGNNFSGPLPNQWESFKNLEYLSLSENSISGPIPVTLGELSSLRELYLDSNKLSGKIPGSIGQLSSLKILDIWNNSFDGVVSELHFANLTSLTQLEISYNELVLSFDPAWVPPFQLQSIDMSCCPVGPKFPLWLRTQRNISSLYMSNASISDEVPNWLSDILLNAGYLDLSNNMLRGPISRMDGNKMQLLQYLFLSGNNLSGSIPNSLCAMEKLTFLDLSKNQLSGRLPLCLKKLEKLEWISLGDNRLSGQITNSFCHIKPLQVLLLHKNGFDKMLPKCLSNLANLLLLDLSDNDFTGEIPPFGKHSQSLALIDLKNNSFTGGIPSQLCQLNYLQFLSLAQNNISGSIPPCLNGLLSMVGDIVNQPYWPGMSLIYVMVDTKGISIKYGETLRIFHSIDLSTNNLNGEIPKELIRLVKLQNLNLSRNNLSGKIPSNIGNLKNLESLDLSNNVISGRIPPSISNLDFMSYLNLSFNNLSGPIPSSNHLRTVDGESVYRGNDGLCGPPLLKVCPGDEQHPDINGRDGDFWNRGETNEGNLDTHNWFYAGLGPGFTIGFLGFCSALHFKQSWRKSYFQAIDRIIKKLMIWGTITTLLFKRAFQER